MKKIVGFLFSFLLLLKFACAMKMEPGPRSIKNALCKILFETCKNEASLSSDEGKILKSILDLPETVTTKKEKDALYKTSKKILEQIKKLDSKQI